MVSKGGDACENNLEVLDEKLAYVALRTECFDDFEGCVKQNPYFVPVKHDSDEDCVIRECSDDVALSFCLGSDPFDGFRY